MGLERAGAVRRARIDREGRSTHDRDDAFEEHGTTAAIGHISYAMRDPGARRGMRTGSVTSAWARHYHAAWAEEVLDAEPTDATDSSIEVGQE